VTERNGRALKAPEENLRSCVQLGFIEFAHVTFSPAQAPDIMPRSTAGYFTAFDFGLFGYATIETRPGDILELKTFAESQQESGLLEKENHSATSSLSSSRTIVGQCKPSRDRTRALVRLKVVRVSEPSSRSIRLSWWRRHPASLRSLRRRVTCPGVHRATISRCYSHSCSSSGANQSAKTSWARTKAWEPLKNPNLFGRPWNERKALSRLDLRLMPCVF
jgi:hypothetical protein